MERRCLATPGRLDPVVFTTRIRQGCATINRGRNAASSKLHTFTGQLPLLGVGWGDGAIISFLGTLCSARGNRPLEGV